MRFHNKMKSKFRNTKLGVIQNAWAVVSEDVVNEALVQRLLSWLTPYTLRASFEAAAL